MVPVSSRLTGDRTRSIARTVQRSLKASMKEALKEALDEVEAERQRRSRVRRVVGALTFLAAGTAAGYLLRERRIPAEAAQTVAERTEQVSETAEALGESESRDRGGSTVRRLLATGVGLGVAYGIRRWYGSRRRRAEPITAGTEEAADRIEAGGRATADRVEEVGETAGDVRERTKETIDERTDEDDE